MASAEGRAGDAANYFTQDFRIPPNYCDHQSSVSKKLKSDWAPSSPINGHIHADSGCTPLNPSSERLSDMKWWLHVNSNLGGEANYTCQHLNSWQSEIDAVYAGFLDDNVKIGGDQSVKNFDALSYTGSSNKAIERPWNVSPTCMKNKDDTRMPKIEAALNNDTHLTPKKKDWGDFYFSDEKTGPWWRTAGKDELASLVAQKSLEHVGNCDLPQPQTRHFRQRPLYPKGVDHDKTPPSSLNQKAESVSSNADGYTSGTPTSGCSFQDSDMHFSQSKGSGSSDKDCQINSENNSMAELLEALCHSQTRAREAEKAAQQAYNEKEHILSLFFRQASQLFAYRQWFHMLQLENLCLQLRNKNQPLLNLFPAAIPWVSYRGMELKRRGRARKRRSSNIRRCGIGTCAVAFAVGLGLAGAGLLLGWTMGWMFPPL